MTQLSLDSAPAASGTLLCGLTPSGRIDVHPGSPDAGPGLSTTVERRIIEAFNAGRGHGVLHLGAGELNTELHPSLSYWRDIGRSFVARVCGALDPTDPTSLVIPAAAPDEIAAFAEAAPPMPGAELLTPALLGDLWADLGKALAVEAARFKDGGVQGYLKKQSSVWHVVGHVCFHLAENKRDPAYPFAFIATYVHKVSRQAKPQHLPLGQALKDYAGAKNRQQFSRCSRPCRARPSRAISSVSWSTPVTSITRCPGPPRRPTASSARSHCTSKPVWSCACPTGGAPRAAPVPRSLYRWAARRHRRWVWTRSWTST